MIFISTDLSLSVIDTDCTSRAKYVLIPNRTSRNLFSQKIDDYICEKNDNIGTARSSWLFNVKKANTFESPCNNEIV